jgi:hypothetical protein
MEARKLDAGVATGPPQVLALRALNAVLLHETPDALTGALRTQAHLAKELVRIRAAHRWQSLKKQVRLARDLEHARRCLRAGRELQMEDVKLVAAGAALTASTAALAAALTALTAASTASGAAAPFKGVASIACASAPTFSVRSCVCFLLIWAARECPAVCLPIVVCITSLVTAALA